MDTVPTPCALSLKKTQIAFRITSACRQARTPLFLPSRVDTISMANYTNHHQTLRIWLNVFAVHSPCIQAHSIKQNVTSAILLILSTKRSHQSLVDKQSARCPRELCLHRGFGAALPRGCSYPSPVTETLQKYSSGRETPTRTYGVITRLLQ